MEAQLLYFTPEGSNSKNWKYTAVPISKAYLDTIPPGSSSKTDLGGLIDVIGKLCSKNGDMPGWELHSIEPSAYGHLAGCYQTKVILTRTLQVYNPLSSPGIGSVSPGITKVDEAGKQGRVGGFLDT